MTKLKLLLLPLIVMMCGSVLQAQAPPAIHTYLNPPRPMPYVGAVQTFQASIENSADQKVAFSDDCNGVSHTGLHNEYSVQSLSQQTCTVTAVFHADPAHPRTATVTFTASPQDLVANAIHPRLSLTPTMVARMKSEGWNSTSNPKWVMLLSDLTIATTESDKKWCFSFMSCPAGQTHGQPISWVGTNISTPCGALQWCDTGSDQGPVFDSTEGYAKFFAFMALFTSGQQSQQLAARSHELMMWALRMADGANPLTAQNCGYNTNGFRDCGMATGNRPHQSEAESWAQAVDWNYSSYSTADLKVINDVFSAWANLEQSTYVTGYGCLSPFPPASLGNGAIPSDRRCMRWEMNNLGSAAYRASLMFGLALDSIHDGPRNPTQPWYASQWDARNQVYTTNSLRAYAYNGVKAWTYLRWLLLEDPGITSSIAEISPSGLGEGQGGGSPESSEYSPNFGYTYQAQWALHTAGWDDPLVFGPQASLSTGAVWDNTVWYFLNSISPTNHFVSAYEGWDFDIQIYGDNNSTYGFQTQNEKSLVPVAIRDWSEGNNPVELNAARWLMTHAFYGGCGTGTNGACGTDYTYFNRRMHATVGSNDFQTKVDLFLALGDPLASACDPHAPGCDPNGEADPRNDADYSHDWSAPGWGQGYFRPSWTGNSWFSQGSSWDSIDHQVGDSGRLDLWFNGPFVVPFTTYTNAIGEATDWKNAGILTPNPDNNPDQSYHQFPSYQQELTMLARRGSGLSEITGATPMVLNASTGSYAARYQDNTGEHNYCHGTICASNVAYSARTNIYLKLPNPIVVVYDTGKTTHPLAAGMHKSLAFDVARPPTINGQTTKMSNGYITTILPEADDYSVQVCQPPATSGGTAPGACNLGATGPSPAQYMVTVTSASNVDHFLTVLEGSTGAMTPATRFAESNGEPADGVRLDGAVNTAVLFLQNPVVHGGAFNQLSYSVPRSTKTHYVIGLAPGATYHVSLAPGSSILTPLMIVINSGGSGQAVAADATGTITFTTQ